MNKLIIHLCIHSFLFFLFVENITFITISMLYNSTMKRLRAKFFSEQTGNVSEIKLIAMYLAFLSSISSTMYRR